LASAAGRSVPRLPSLRAVPPPPLLLLLLAAAERTLGGSM